MLDKGSQITHHTKHGESFSFIYIWLLCVEYFYVSAVLSYDQLPVKHLCKQWCTQGVAQPKYYEPKKYHSHH